MPFDVARLQEVAQRAKGVLKDRQPRERKPNQRPQRTARKSVTNYGDGPGTMLRKRLKAWGISSCAGCNKTAREMDELGPDECHRQRERLASEILPRAKQWMRKGEFRAWFMSRFSDRVEDAVLTVAILKLIDDAVIESRELRQRRTVDVMVVIAQGVGQWHESQTGFSELLGDAGITNCTEYLPPNQPSEVEEALREISPKVCIIRAMPFTAAEVAGMADGWPDVRFVVVCHSLPSHLVVWKDTLGKFADFIRLSNEKPNVYLGTPDERVPWGRLSKSIWLPNSTGEVPPGDDRGVIGPVDISLVGRRDTVKNVPNQIIAAAIANRTRECRLHLMISGGTADFEALAKACDIDCFVHQWQPHEQHRLRVAGMIDIGMQAGFCESFNYVALEHLLSGKPVVGSPAIRFLPTEMQADPNDIDGMAEMILNLAEQIDADPVGRKTEWREMGNRVAAELNAALPRIIRTLL